MSAPHGSFAIIKDVDVHTVEVENRFKLPCVFLTLNPPNHHPTKGSMIFNTNPDLQNDCSDIWYANGIEWFQLGLCIPNPQ